MGSRAVRRTPQEKKRFSLARDRRNTYGENDKASRKNIPRSKQQGLMQLRRAVDQKLRITGRTDETVIDDVAVDVAAVDAARSRKRFRKSPDTCLELVLAQKGRRKAG
jgi:hypothetical protein